MNILESNGRVKAVYFTRDSIVVDLKDGRSISVQLKWYPKLLKASPKARAHWEISEGGYGIHWPEIDEDLSTEGLLRGAPSPAVRKANISKNKKKIKSSHFLKKVQHPKNNSLRRTGLKTKIKN